MRFTRLTSVLLALALMISIPVAPAIAADPWPSGTYRVSLSSERLAGSTRYSTSVAVARKGFPAWKGVDHVVIASGEDRVIGDGLGAAGVCWAYNAPLLLVKSSGITASVRTALLEIRAANEAVKVIVVGGQSAVADAVIADLGTIVGPENVSRVRSSGDRYAMAAAAADLASAVASDTARTIPARALVVNGTGVGGFADALAASAVSAATGIPLLLVEKDRVPAATKQALAAGKPGAVIVVGGTAVVSDATYAAVGGTARWAGANRYITATKVAAGARGRGWLTGATTGIVSAGADAFVGAVHIGRARGPLLHVKPTAIPKDTAAYLHANSGVLTRARLFGGTKVLSTALANELKGNPTKPRIVKPKSGARLGKRAQLVVATGVNTTELRVYVADKLVAKKSARSYATVDLGILPTPAKGEVYRIVARTPDGRQTAVTRSQPRHSYPAPTSIVVDKSDFRLYFFKNDVHVKSYPVAIGRTNAETPVAMWRIDSKYYTSPTSVYGPRKMRMYRKRGSYYVYTAYNIHGTNVPSSIGTKASAGCIRLYNKDILDLFPRVPLGTLVQTRE